MDELKTILEFIVFTVILKVIVAHWIADQIQKVFKRYFLLTERDMALWLHYRNKAQNKGHHHKNPLDCNEGKCATLTR